MKKGGRSLLLVVNKTNLNCRYLFNREACYFRDVFYGKSHRFHFAGIFKVGFSHALCHAFCHAFRHAFVSGDGYVVSVIVLRLLLDAELFAEFLVRV